MNMIKMNATYLLDTLSGFEPQDIEDDSFEVAVNDDQFGQCSIVELAGKSSELIKELEAKNEALIKTLNEIKNLPSSRMDEGSTMAYIAIKTNKAT